MKNTFSDNALELISNPSQVKAFENHLDIKTNSRIIFSGKFGIGKTTFLKDFFNKEENRSIYNTIHIYPINYSISSNEDILDLLKYDVINELLNSSSIKIGEPVFTNTEVLNGFITNHFDEIVVPFIEMLPKIGKTISKAYKNINELAAKFEAFKKEMRMGESEELKVLVKKIEQKWTYYQNDFYTDFIYRKLEEIKGDGKKQNVLIIDDLDRIDPEHIFRLFNIFGAHLHSNDGEANKWGFDKIIFTCDIDNIEAIYHYKYGDKTDFTGYIDKFYTHNIFRIDNRAIIQTWIEKKLPFQGTDYGRAYLTFLIEILNSMLTYGVVNFRNIKSLSKEVIDKNINDMAEIIRKNNKFKEAMFIWVATILSSVVGDTDLLINKLKECKETRIAKPNNKFSTGGNNIVAFISWHLLPITEFSGRNLESGRTGTFYLKDTLSHYASNYPNFFKYSTTYNMGRIICDITSAVPAQHPEVYPSDSVCDELMWPLLLKAVTILKDNGYLT